MDMNILVMLARLGFDKRFVLFRLVRYLEAAGQSGWAGGTGGTERIALWAHCGRYRIGRQSSPAARVIALAGCLYHVYALCLICALLLGPRREDPWRP